jgi:signal peptidase I
MTGGYVTSNQSSRSMPNAAFAQLMKAVLDKGAPFRFEAGGYSMSPFIRHGDLITVGPSPSLFRRGDVIAFMSPETGKLTVHRIIRVSPCRGYLIKGDNTPAPDGRVKQSAIIGRVIRVEHRGKRVRIGLGPERALLAFLSRIGLLPSLVRFLWRLSRLIGIRSKP